MSLSDVYVTPGILRERPAIHTYGELTGRGCPR
jgi:hypothetical protein